MLDGDKKSPLKNIKGGGDNDCNLFMTVINLAAPPQILLVVSSVMLYWDILRCMINTDATYLDDYEMRMVNVCGCQ